LALLPLAGLSKDSSDINLSGGHNNLNFDYLGDNTRLGIGVNNDGKFSAEIYQVFAEKDNSAAIAEAWFGSGGSGGLKLNYHWLAEDLNQVYKTFVAIDQNEDQDRKASLGAGVETDKLFYGGYLSRSISSKRQLTNSITKENKFLTGIDNIGTWQQAQTITTITKRFAQAYDYGIGLRIGRYLIDELWRLRLGTDYEWGDYNSDQLTYSFGLEAFIAGTGHSIALDIEHSERSGEFEKINSDTRSLLTWRYSFGNNERKNTNNKSIQAKPELTTNNAIISSNTAKENKKYRIIKHKASS